ncbi:MAG: cation-translocating P-type ATPase [Terrimicrobiaceae bacterium]|nr:cation-translocating P-type ATPase [Terrimicrobiaceae bacterium]
MTCFMSSCCHCATPDARDATTPRSADWVRIAFAAAIAAQSMIFSLAVNVSPPAGRTRWMLHAALAISAVIVFALVGLPLLRAALDAAARGRIVFEQLFLAGIFGAFGASLVSTLTGVGHVYYEVVAILLAIYTFGRALGERRRSAALDAARALGTEFETCARFDADGNLATVPVRDIRRGDVVEIAAGDGIPVDGMVVQGAALVNEATLTGEPFPATRRPGDLVLAGSRLLDGPLRVRATADGDGRLLDAMLARVRAAQSRGSRLEREADRLVAWFLPAVLLIAAVTFAAWTAHSGWTAGLFNALAVILVACPCSMGLATPIGIWSALADVGRRGLIADTGDLVERLARVDRVIFDKTGTLADEHLEIVEIACMTDVSRETLLAQVAAIEAASTHPIARAFRRPIGPAAAADVNPISGVGIEGRVGAVRLRIGNAALLAGRPQPALAGLRRQLQHADAATHEVFILRDGALAGIAILRERLRDPAREVIAELEAARIPCRVLTGDRADAAAAHGLASVEAGLSPVEKAARVREWSRDGRALFVGDGANDAPAMAEAHASLCFANGSPFAREVAMGEVHDLRAIPYALARCRAAVRTIRQNLLFAAAYNFIGIGLAVAGILHPVAAALLMLGSSVTVSWRALRKSDARLTPRAHPPSQASTDRGIPRLASAQS